MSIKNICLAIVCIGMLALNECVYFKWIDVSSPHFLALSTGLVFAILTIHFIYELHIGNKGDDEENEHIVPEVPSKSNVIVTLVSLLQEKGRLIDFAMEDVTSYSDAQIGQVARIVHQGTKEVITSVLGVKPFFDGEEGEMITLDHVDPETYKVIGAGSKRPPFTAQVIHRGWQTTKFDLPENNQVSPNVIQSIEIEVK